MSQTSVPAEGKLKQTARSNRRAIIRYRCAPATIGKVISADDHEFQRAWVLDFSLRGVGMQLTRPLEPGRLIILSIKSNDGTKVFELPAHVAHCSPVPHGDWFVGCELTNPLTAEDLDQLL